MIHAIESDHVNLDNEKKNAYSTVSIRRPSLAWLVKPPKTASKARHVDMSQPNNTTNLELKNF